MSVRRPWMLVLMFVPAFCYAQSPQEKNFSAPVSTVQAALKNLPGGTSGSLPILDGFIIQNTRKLDFYKRPYYQLTVHISAVPSGGSLVRVTAKITAWNSDPTHSGYEVLRSNGRLESDLLDRLQERLGQTSEDKTSRASITPTTGTASKTSPPSTSPPSEMSAPMPQFPTRATTTTPAASGDSTNQDPALEREAKGLEDLVQNQSRPTNLIAVRQNQTPVLQDPRSNAKVLFMASAEDEFEVLDTTPEWVHVRISGLSRGWLQRSGVEMLDGSENVASAASVPAVQPPASASKSSALFSVSAEEDGSFPGDWGPLKGKNVKIISIQQAPGTGRITSPQDKMRFAEGLFKNATAGSSTAGLVLIFDAEDGGMVAATQAVLEKWKNGSLSEQALWRQCYLDPPEILGSQD